MQTRGIRPAGALNRAKPHSALVKDVNGVFRAKQSVETGALTCVPEFDAPRCYSASASCDWRPVNLRNKGRLVFAQESLDRRYRRNKVVCKFTVRCCADNDQQRDAMANHRVAFVGLIADTTVMGQRDPAARAYDLQPFFIWGIGREVVGVAFDNESCRSENLRELFSKIAVGEPDNAQAARS